MKKLIIIAALVLAAASAKAQNAVTIDTTTVVTMQELIKTNIELVGINDALRQHSKMAAWSAPVMMAGTAILVTHPTDKVDNYRDNWHVFGIATVTAGALLFMASYSPLLRNKVKVNEKGVVINIP